MQTTKRRLDPALQDMEEKYLLLMRGIYHIDSSHSTTFACVQCRASEMPVKRIPNGG